MIGSIFFFLWDLKTQKFSIFCVSIYYRITNVISFAVSVLFMSNNAYFIQYNFNIIPFTYNSNIAGCLIQLQIRANPFWSTSGQLMKSIYFRISLGLDGLILVWSSDEFSSTFVKMANFQSIKNSWDIFLSDNFSLIRLPNSSAMFSLIFYNFWSLVPYN